MHVMRDAIHEKTEKETVIESDEARCGDLNIRIVLDLLSQFSVVPILAWADGASRSCTVSLAGLQIEK